MLLTIVAALAVVLGSALGSFVGVVSMRGLKASLGGRSHCDDCGRTLAWYELVPLLSYPALRGRCRTCHKQISPEAFLWEAGGATASLAVMTGLLLSGLVSL